jgi:hypothetical protein
MLVRLLLWHLLLLLQAQAPLGARAGAAAHAAACSDQQHEFQSAASIVFRLCATQCHAVPCNLLPTHAHLQHCSTSTDGELLHLHTAGPATHFLQSPQRTRTSPLPAGPKCVLGTTTCDGAPIFNAIMKTCSPAWGAPSTQLQWAACSNSCTAVAWLIAGPSLVPHSDGSIRMR